MAAKDSKDSRDFSSRIAKKKGHSKTSASMKDTKPRKKRSKGPAKPENLASPLKAEGVLDPQLCQSVPASGQRIRRLSSFQTRSLTKDYDSQSELAEHLMGTPDQIRVSPFTGQGYHDHRHQAYIPRMREWHGSKSPQIPMTQTASTSGSMNQHPVQSYETDGESDYFQTFLRSPTRTAYPDPSEVTNMRPDFLLDSSSSVIKRDSTERDTRVLDVKDGRFEDVNSTHLSPVLKGVKWPGMSLFDSASLDAQRLRNQKKDESVLEQMEHNSAMVEQMERIYWPDGTLKKQRLITGNVDSSPPRETTPQPKLPKRKRTKADRAPLTNLGIDARAPGKKMRVVRAASGLPATQASELRKLSTKALAELEAPQSVYPRSAHMGYDPPSEDEYERQFTHGRPPVFRKKAFDIFNDQNTREGNTPSLPTTKANDSAFSQAVHSHRSSLYSESIGSPLHRAPMSGAGMRDTSHLRSRIGKSRVIARDENAENIAPVLDEYGRIEDEAAPVHAGRVTQRYVSVTGNQPPQFFSSMPPGMDFGGLMEPRYHGTTLNPLNPYLRQHRFLQNQARAAFSPKAAAYSAGSIGGSEHPDSRNLGGKAADAHT